MRESVLHPRGHADGDTVRARWGCSIILNLGERDNLSSTSSGIVEASVVVPTWKRPEYLTRCLAALQALEPAPIRILVVARTGDHQAREVVAEATATQEVPTEFVEVDGAGFVAPLREAIARASSSILAVIDDDAEPEGRWLGELVAPLSDDRTGCAGGRELRAEGIPQDAIDRKAGRVTWYGKYVGRLSHVDSPHPLIVDAVGEGNWAWRSHLLGRLEFDPLFDEGDGLHYGLDLCLQAKKLGYRTVHAPKARMFHHRAPRIGGGGPRRDDREARALAHGRNLTYIALKHYGSGRLAAFFVWWFLIGERQAYGLATALWDLPKGPLRVLRLLRIAMRGRLEGIRAWRERRKRLPR